MNQVDQPRIEAAVREILLAVGEDPDRDGLAETPARVARSYQELFSDWRRTPPSCCRPPSTSITRNSCSSATSS